MKKNIIFILLLAVSTALPAKNRMSIHEDNYHFGYVSAGAGYTSLSYQSKDISATGGLGYLFGLGYEFRRHNFWVSAGLQFQHLSSKLSVEEYTYTPSTGGMDDLGRTVSAYHYTINQRDEQSWLTVDIPVMAGYYNNGFYCGAGFKVAFPAITSDKIRGTYDIDAEYDKYIGTISDVHYYTSYPYKGESSRYKLRPMASVVGEIGYDVLSSMGTNDVICHMLKIGLYAEYGLRTIKTAPQAQQLTVNPNNITDVKINPYLATAAGSHKWTVPYFVGLKVTYMIGGSRSATATWHKGCQCYGY